MRDIREVAADLGLAESDLEIHGAHRAKIRLDSLGHTGTRRGRYVLVTGMTPTAHAVGKTVTAIGLAMGLERLGSRAAVALRQSSLGPTFGAKGGGAGGGAAGLVPLEESLLGLGSDLFAVEAANNLLAAVIDDSLYRGGDLDPASVTWRRVLDVDDRALRHVLISHAGHDQEAFRPTGFDITAASELMALLALSRGLDDMRRRLDQVVPAWDRQGRPVSAARLGVSGAMAALLRDALQPNLLQTGEGTAALVHTGPFGNIAPGCSSVLADRFALFRVDFLITEAGFGADLGGEKFFDLKCPATGYYPDLAVLVVSLTSLREHAGANRRDPSLAAGLANLRHHIGILRSFGVPVVVAVNRASDETSPEQLEYVRQAALDAGAAGSAEHTAFANGGAGCEELALLVAEVSGQYRGAHGLFRGDEPVLHKVERIAIDIYGAAEVVWQPDAAEMLDRLDAAGYGRLPVCIAKTPLSLSHDPKLLGAPTGFSFPIRELRLAAGAGYVTVYAGDITTMPGLPSHPRLLNIDIDAQGRITGLL